MRPTSFARCATLKDSIEYLRHIRDECRYLVDLSARTGLDGFLADEDLKRASVRSLEIIGEATKKLPDEYRRKHPEINWGDMAGMRDVLIHDYLGVDYVIVWDVMKNHIPPLLEKIARLLV